MKPYTIFVFSFLYINCFGQQYSKSWKDLNYAGDTKVYNILDIYLPAVRKPAYPAVIEIYGSAWFSDNSKGVDLPSLGKALLDAGFAVIMPNHRSSGDAKFPAQIQDIKAVVRFVRANAEKYQIDTSFIGITGYSSGGHLAALAGTSGGVKRYTVDSVTEYIEGDVGQYLSYNSSVDAVVDWFGPTDFLVMNSCGSQLDHNAANSPESSLIGGPIQQNKDKCELANPVTYIDSSDPPFLIIHGDADPLVPPCESEMLFNALQKAKVPSQFILVPGGQHGPGVLTDKYFKMMTDFFLNQLKITREESGEEKNPIKFSLSRNYSDSLNSITTITFTLPMELFVRLTVFDLLGRQEALLVSENMLPGTRSRQWNAKGLSSGTYFFRLEAGPYIQTKKLAILK